MDTTHKMKKQIQTSAFQNLYADYTNFIYAKGFKGKMYEANVKTFLIWLENKGIIDIKAVTTPEMMEYYNHLMERPNQKHNGTLADSTIKLHLLSITLFVEQLLENNMISKAFLIPKHGNQYQEPRHYLTIDEVKNLYQNTENPLERVILSIAYGCGLRRAEMEQLNTNDILLSTGMLIVRNGKNEKRREVPMSDTVLKDVKQYITEYRYQKLIHKHPEQAFFISKKGNRMSGDTINKNLKKIINQTGNQNIIDKEISLHSLRHSIANHLTENNASIDFIRSFLGHSYINTAYLYALKNKKRTKVQKQHTLIQTVKANE